MSFTFVNSRSAIGGGTTLAAPVGTIAGDIVVVYGQQIAATAGPSPVTFTTIQSGFDDTNPAPPDLNVNHITAIDVQTPIDGAWAVSLAINGDTPQWSPAINWNDSDAQVKFKVELTSGMGIGTTILTTSPIAGGKRYQFEFVGTHAHKLMVVGVEGAFLVAPGVQHIKPVDTVGWRQIIYRAAYNDFITPASKWIHGGAWWKVFDGLEDWHWTVGSGGTPSLTAFTYRKSGSAPPAIVSDVSASTPHLGPQTLFSIPDSNVLRPTLTSTGVVFGFSQAAVGGSSGAGPASPFIRDPPSGTTVPFQMAHDSRLLPAGLASYAPATPSWRNSAVIRGVHYAWAFGDEPVPPTPGSWRVRRRTLS